MVAGNAILAEAHNHGLLSLAIPTAGEHAPGPQQGANIKSIH